MHEYIADQKIGKKLYREKRKLYKRYKIGTVVMCIMLSIMVLINIIFVQKAENTYQIAENLFIGLGIDIILIIGAALARALAISGGHEVLRSRVAEKCIFTDQHFILEYVPHAHETMEYECIQSKIRYRDIERIVDEDSLGRLAIYGTYTILKYRTMHSEKDKVMYTVSDMPIYVYAYYNDFDSLKRELFLLL